MSRKEALKEFIGYTTYDIQPSVEATKMAIEALKQEPCEDCISRQVAIDTIESWLSCDDYNEAERHIMRAMQSVLYDLPSVTPQPKTGHWIDDCGGVKCSCCGYSIDDCFYAKTYCTNCGCRMESEVES